MSGERRRPPAIRDSSGVGHGWLALSDDDLLCAIQQLADGHGADAELLEVVRSARHFFIRQEAAKRVEGKDALKAHAGDRHIGQILVRGLGRADDVAYLERLAQESRHVEVKKAAEAQLEKIKAAAGKPATASARERG